MAKENIGLTVKKADNFSEWYSQICLEQGAKLVDIRYKVQGSVVHRPWAFRILRRIYELLEEEVENDNHEPFLFPTMIPQEHLMKEKEHAGFTPEVFWVTRAGNETLDEPLALRPTGETQIYPIYALWIRSHNDLPLKGYQSRITVFRNEKTTRPFIRGREFMFFETHDVFATHDEAMSQIKKDLGIMSRVVKEKLCLPFIFLKRPQWDKFMGADDTYTSDTLMPDGKKSQMGTTHDLGQRFAKAYEIKFVDADSTEKIPYQTCFGPGIYRIMAALIAIHGDDTGLALPSVVSPIHIIIVPITFSKKEEDSIKVLEACRKLEEDLKKNGFKAKADLSSNTPGFKFNHWEMMGVPLRIELGPKEIDSKKVTIALRAPKEKVTIDARDLHAKAKELLDKVDDEIRRRAEEYFKDNTTEAKKYDDVRKKLGKHRGFIKVPFCSINIDGKKCADKLKEDTTAVVCGVAFENKEKPVKGEKCIICNKEAKEIVYIAKTY